MHDKMGLHGEGPEGLRPTAMRGGRSDEEEGATRRKERRAGRSEKESEKMKKMLEDASFTTSVLLTDRRSDGWGTDAGGLTDGQRMKYGWTDIEVRREGRRGRRAL